MRYLLDTNVISEVSKGEQGDANVNTWYETMEPDSLCISVLVVGEIRAGVEKLRLRQPDRVAAFECQLVLVIDLFADRIDRRIAEQWGRLNARQRRPAVDGLLAATALVHGLTVVTRNARDFASTGAEVFNPFDPLL